MQTRLDRAIKLREEKSFAEANSILMGLAEEFPEDPLILYHCAWSFDVLGEEARAVPYYERAIRSGLSGKELEGAYLGLGSTYRTLGEYGKSQEILLNGIKLFPANKALQTFYAMTLYNLKEHQKAMELLLKCLAETSENEDISAYSRAIGFYSDKLDEIWK